MAVELVDGEERRARSRMLAYDNLGRRIGRSATWIRRLIGGEAVGLAQDTYEKLVDAYGRHCARLEQEAETARKRAEALRAQNDALEARLARPAPGGD